MYNTAEAESRYQLKIRQFLAETPSTFTFPATPIFHDDHFGKLNSVTHFFTRSLEALAEMFIRLSGADKGVTFRVSKKCT